MTDYHELNDEANKAILQELADESGDADIAAVISCYNIGAKGSDIRKEMAKQKVPEIKKCATYLGLYTGDDTKKLKAQIIIDIMSRLNCLLKDLCGICGEYYSNNLKDKPTFTCLICHQGCHSECFQPISTIFKVLDENQRKAIQFICTSCQSDHCVDEDKIIINAPKVKKSPTKMKPPPDGELEDQEEEEHDLTQPRQENQHDTPGSPSSHEENIHADDSGQHVAEDTANISICPMYKWGRCPDYKNCNYRHPPRCWNWLSHGKCSFKNKCKYHHPPLCYNSIWEKQCLNLECKFFHITKTLRYKMEDEQLKTSLQAPNYHTQNPLQTQNYHAQFPQLPQAQSLPMYQPSNVPHQPPSFVTQTVAHPTNTPAHQSIRPHHQLSPQNQHVQQTQNTFNQSDMSFLAKTIKEALKEDLAIGLANIRRDLSAQIQNRTVFTPNVAQPQVQVPQGLPQVTPQTQAPNVYSLQVVPRQQ